VRIASAESKSKARLRNALSWHTIRAEAWLERKRLGEFQPTFRPGRTPLSLKEAALSTVSTKLVTLRIRSVALLAPVGPGSLPGPRCLSARLTGRGLAASSQWSRPRKGLASRAQGELKPVAPHSRLLLPRLRRQEASVILGLPAGLLAMRARSCWMWIETVPGLAVVTGGWGEDGCQGLTSQQAPARSGRGQGR
jgi:hypothetical protein